MLPASSFWYPIGLSLFFSLNLLKMLFQCLTFIFQFIKNILYPNPNYLLINVSGALVRPELRRHFHFVVVFAWLDQRHAHSGAVQGVVEGLAMGQYQARDSYSLSLPSLPLCMEGSPSPPGDSLEKGLREAAGSTKNTVPKPRESVRLFSLLFVLLPLPHLSPFLSFL